MSARKGIPSDYCIVGNDPDRRLSPVERATLTGGNELSRMLSRVASQLTNFSYGDKLGEIHAARIYEAANFYGRDSWKTAPETFFTPPTGIIAPKTTTVHGFSNGEILDIEFKSLYEVHNPQVRPDWKKHKENQTVHARMWRHKEKAPATIVAIHGWTMGDQRLNSMAFLPGLFYRMGLDIVMIELPFHGRRMPKGGDSSDLTLFPSVDVARTNEAMGQIISDLRQLFLYLKADGANHIGVMGMSLGAYAGALWASLDPVDFCIPMVPLVSMSEMAWQALTSIPSFPRLKREGLTFDLLVDAYHVHAPLSHTPKVSRERALIIAGLGDLVVPSRQPNMLWEHWGRPSLFWLSGGHATQFTRDAVFQEITGFFETLGYLD